MVEQHHRRQVTSVFTVWSLDAMFTSFYIVKEILLVLLHFCMWICKNATPLGLLVSLHFSADICEQRLNKYHLDLKQLQKLLLFVFYGEKCSAYVIQECTANRIWSLGLDMSPPDAPKSWPMPREANSSLDNSRWAQRLTLYFTLPSCFMNVVRAKGFTGRHSRALIWTWVAQITTQTDGCVLIHCSEHFDSTILVAMLMFKIWFI